MLHGQTEIYVKAYPAGLSDIDALQLHCRVLENRNFEVLSIAYSNLHYIVTVRGPRSLFINYTGYPTGELSHTHYQMGPFDGDFSANEALRKFLSKEDTTKYEDAYVTGFRDHSRVFVGTPDAEDQ